MSLSSITCAHCGHTFSSHAPGTRHRNHCPHCLSSVHLDIEPGDRASNCRSVMTAFSVAVRPSGEWEILHRCNRCGVIHANRIAGDDSAVVLMSLAVKPLAHPPFPWSELYPDPRLCGSP